MSKNSISVTYFGQGRGNYGILFYAYSVFFEWKTSITALHRTEQARQQLNTIPGLAARLANLMDLDMVSRDFLFCFNMYQYLMNCERWELSFDFIRQVVHGTYRFRNVDRVCYFLNVPIYRCDKCTKTANGLQSPCEKIVEVGTACMRILSLVYQLPRLRLVKLNIRGLYGVSWSSEILYLGGVGRRKKKLIMCTNICPSLHRLPDENNLINWRKPLFFRESTISS